MRVEVRFGGHLLAVHPRLWWCPSRRMAKPTPATLCRVVPAASPNPWTTLGTANEGSAVACAGRPKLQFPGHFFPCATPHPTWVGSTPQHDPSAGLCLRVRACARLRVWGRPPLGPPKHLVPPKTAHFGPKTVNFIFKKSYFGPFGW